MCPIFPKKGGLEMNRQEIEDALFREAMAAAAFRVEPSSANKMSWDAARKVVDVIIEEITWG
jgi:hypothetical protein